MNTHRYTKLALLVAMSTLSGSAVADEQFTPANQPVTSIAKQVNTVSVPASDQAAPQSVRPVDSHSVAVDFVPPGGNGGTLDKLQTKASLLKVQLEIAKLEKSIADTKTGIAGSSSGGPASVTPALSAFPHGYMTNPVVIPTQSAPSSPAPSVLMISGVGNTYTARIRLSEGGVVTAHNGQTIAKGLRVIRIGSDGVLMNINGVAKTLYVDSRDTSATRSIVNPQMLTAMPYDNPSMGSPTGARQVSPAIMPGKPPAATGMNY